VRWEYRVFAAEIVERWSAKKQAQEVQAFQERLNGLGAEGWEMISFDTVPLTGSFSNNIKGYIYLTFFKRPVPA
jgi:hypothetical protein